MTEGSLEEWGLPSPEELVPLTQTLISPTLAAFLDRIQFPTMNSVPSHCPEESTTVSNEEEDAAAPRMLKRPRLVWTPQLHTRFVEAVHQLGTKNAVPKSIMQIMNVDGLTRENVASHLQKYRNYLKRHRNHHHLPPADSPFIFPFPLPSPHARSSSPNLTLIPQHEPNSSHHQFLPFFSTKGYS